jgi:hypothetical protein
MQLKLHFAARRAASLLPRVPADEMLSNTFTARALVSTSKTKSWKAFKVLRRIYS